MCIHSQGMCGGMDALRLRYSMYFHYMYVLYVLLYIQQYIASLPPLPPPPPPPSQYNRTDVLPGELYHDTQALDPVWNTLWQLALAGLARGVLTVFTYGMKVRGGEEEEVRVCVRQERIVECSCDWEFRDDS